MTTIKKHRKPKALLIQTSSDSRSTWPMMLHYIGFDVQGIEITQSFVEGLQSISTEQPDLVFFLSYTTFQVDEEWKFIRDIMQIFPGEIVVAGIFDIRDAVPSDRIRYFHLPLDLDEIWEDFEQIFQRSKISVH